MKQLQIEIPQSWNDITLEKYLELQTDLKTYSDDEDAMTSILMHHLCGIDPSITKGLSVVDYHMIKGDLGSFMSNVELPLQQFITIEGVEYGFEPNLSKMSYGAFLDITKWPSLAIDKNWSSIMSVLYRPIVRREKHHYSIEPYTGEDRSKSFLKVPMDVHFGTLFFFINLWTDLLSGTLNSTKIMKDIPQELRPILERSGQVIQQSTKLLTEIYSSSTK
jgi:hypothetical protein